jgi:DNA invertase Pin-like site-specific DNA recombinase
MAIYGYVRVSGAEQNERENIQQKQAEGIDAAKTRGVFFVPSKNPRKIFMALSVLESAGI